MHLVLLTEASPSQSLTIAWIHPPIPHKWSLPTPKILQIFPPLHNPFSGQHLRICAPPYHPYR